jgi:acetyl-CoA carboxylase biotin carboxyl carrier protein
MNIEFIKSVIDTMAQSDMSELELSQGEWMIRLSRRSGAVSAPVSRLPAKAASAPAVRTHIPAATPMQIVAPMFGVVHLQPSPQEPPFVKVGQAVVAGETLCLIEAMKVFVEIRAERDAVVAAIMVDSGQEVISGQPIFDFK